MPAKAARTATEATRQAWDNVQPGDIFFTTGGGLVGSLIRRGTESPYGHCGIVMGVGTISANTWLTAEAFPSFPPWRPGLTLKERSPDTVASVVRLWRTAREQTEMINKSNELVEAKLPYAWSEILVIAAANILPHSWIPNTDLTSAVICSNHVAQCIRAARPDDYETYFRYRPNRMWPGGLHYDLQALLWDSQYNPIKGHIHQFGDAAVRANATHYLKGLIDLSELAHRLESSTRTVTPASRSERKPRMAKYRSKPVEIQAWKITAGDSIRQLMDLIESRGGKVARPAVGFDSTAVLSIRTLEGDMIAGIGDWIIQGTEGEFYPCKDTVFQRKYEPADG